MNKKILVTLAGLLAIVVIAGCSPINQSETPTQSGTEKLSVAATIFPVYDITKNVAGDLASVELILAPGASPHTFDPTPSTLTKLQNVKRIFAIGQGIDLWSFGIADNIPGAEIVELDKNITLLESSESHDEHDEHGDDSDHEHGESDPHYWLNPVNAITMADTIADELGTLDPANAEQYRHNANTFAAMLEAENTSWQTELRSLSTRNVVTFHDGFFYFADHFNLNVLTTFEPFPGKEPTPSYLQELEHEIEEHDVRVLFTEPQLHGASLQQFAKDHDIEVFVLDPLGGVEGRESYIKLIGYNVRTIAEALKER